ncbi:MAG: MarR family transcriptional regulator [Pseudomonadota bacterium]
MTAPNLAPLMDRFVRRLHLSLQAKARSFDSYEVGPVGGMILMVMEEAGPLTMQALANEMVRDKSQMTRMVAPLERKGLVSRAPGAGDARQSIVALTPQGRDFVRALKDVVAQTIDEVLAPIPPKDRDLLAALLSRALT